MNVRPTLVAHITITYTEINRRLDGEGGRKQSCNMWNVNHTNGIPRLVSLEIPIEILKKYHRSSVYTVQSTFGGLQWRNQDFFVGGGAPKDKLYLFLINSSL